MSKIVWLRPIGRLSGSRLARWLELLRRRTVELALPWPTTARRRAQRTHECIPSTMQFIINAAQQPSALQLIRGDTESDQHRDKDEAVPELQPPFDGFEDHFSGNIEL